MHPSRANALLIGVLVLLVGGLALLATLQFRWIDQVSESEELRLRASLDLAARQFGADLQTELRTIVEAFRGRPEDLMFREEEWRRNAEHPNLIERVYVGQPREERGPPFDTRTLEIVLRRRAGRPLPPPSFDEPPPPEEAEYGPTEATIIKLNHDELTKTLLPELAKRHFPDGYDVAIVSRESVVFRTDAAWPDGKTPPDVETPIRLLTPPDQGPGPPRDRPGSEMNAPPRDEPEGWRLLVRRHEGGLRGVVAAARRKNLAVSAGILAILVSTFAMLVYLLRRADRLREQQTEFVAAISHELNTPVAALRSAGENLKDGIITDPAKLTRYGDTIVRESARLGDMIEQVLEFAGMRSRRDRTVHEAIDLAAVIEDAVAQSRWIVANDSVEIVTDLDPGLPQPRGDARSLTRAVQNLIANAVRHGGSGGWVRIHAHRDGDAKVAITVEDRGPGIDGRDAAHLFEPFYRGRRAGAVRGSGLGLTIVHQIVTAHGGSIEIQRRRKSGAAFTITLPVELHG